MVGHRRGRAEQLKRVRSANQKLATAENRITAAANGPPLIYLAAGLDAFRSAIADLPEAEQRQLIAPIVAKLSATAARIHRTRARDQSHDDAE